MPIKHTMHLCNRCHVPWAGPDQPGFNNTCEGCGVALHACANCAHYRPRAQLRCDVMGTEQVLDGSASNKCEAFKFRHALAGEASAAAGSSGSNSESSQDTDDETRPNGREGWEQLFG